MNTAGGEYSSAFGYGSSTRESAFYGSAFGYQAEARNIGSTAIGFQSVADRDYALSVGRAGGEHQIIHVADGTQDTDAVNLRQLQAAVATANAYTDTAVAIGGTAANAYTDNREAAIRGDMADADAATLQAARDHADAGDAATLASARDHADAGDTQTLQSANAYTDARFNAVTGLADSFEAFRGEIDDRFHRQDRRIDRQGAISAAMLNMAINAAGSQSPRGRIAMGAGFQGGEQALSVGYGRKLGKRGSFSLGGAFSSGEKSAGVGFGVDL